MFLNHINFLVIVRFSFFHMAKENFRNFELLLIRIDLQFFLPLKEKNSKHFTNYIFKHPALTHWNTSMFPRKKFKTLLTVNINLLPIIEKNPFIALSTLALKPIVVKVFSLAKFHGIANFQNRGHQGVIFITNW